MLKMIVNLSFICLLMAISTMAQPPAVLDTDRQPLRSDREYYVLPAATDIAGGLTLVNRSDNICPNYVGQEPLSTVVSQGLPVIFRPVSGETIVREGSDLRIAFSAVSICGLSTTWRIGEEDPQTRRRLIVSADRGNPPSAFRIDNNGGLYNLGWCPNCGRPNCPRPRCGAAGILIENGKRLLALDGAAFPFEFRRAN